MDLYFLENRKWIMFNVHFWKSGLIRLMDTFLVFKYFIFWAKKYLFQKEFDCESASHFVFVIFLVWEWEIRSLQPDYDIRIGYSKQLGNRFEISSDEKIIRGNQNI